MLNMAKRRPSKFINEPTKTTPAIVLEPGRILIMGRSILENPGEFYRPVIERISNYFSHKDGKTKIIFGFEYINTSSTKWIYAIFLKLAKARNLAEHAKIVWYYEQGDEDMCDLGYTFKSMVKCPFFVVEVDGISKKSFKQMVSDSL